MNIRYRVTLTQEERTGLEGLVQGGKCSARRIKRAQILLAADKGSSDQAIGRHVSAGTSTVYRTKQRFVEEGLERALSELACCDQNWQCPLPDKYHCVTLPDFRCELRPPPDAGTDASGD